MPALHGLDGEESISKHEQLIRDTRAVLLTGGIRRRDPSDGLDARVPRVAVHPRTVRSRHRFRV